MAEPARRGLSFVLIHGAFHGGWCWRWTAERLRDRGHRVAAPSLTGSGERAHLYSKSVGIGSQVADVLAVIQAEELEDVILVGHSLGALTISAVADHTGHPAIRKLIYFDSPMPDDGQSIFDVVGHSYLDRVKAQGRFDEARGLMMPPPATDYGLSDPDHIAWVERQMTPQAVASFSEKLRLKNPLGNGIPRAYIACTNPPHRTVEHTYRWARERPDVDYREIHAGHDAMVQKPVKLADLLHDIAETEGWS